MTTPLIILLPSDEWPDASSNVIIYECDGSFMQTRRALFGHVQHVLKFPKYFSHNWDSLSECLGDLDWLDAEAVCIRINAADLVLCKGSDIDRINWLQVLLDVCEEHDLAFLKIILRACSIEGHSQLVGKTNQLIAQRPSS